MKEVKFNQYSELINYLRDNGVDVGYSFFSGDSPITDFNKLKGPVIFTNVLIFSKAGVNYGH